MSNDRWLVVLPTYNEADNISSVCSAVLEADPDLHVLVVDDASPDGTAEVVEQLACDDPRVHLMVRLNQRGRGSAGAAGFGWAVHHGFDGVVEMDADGSHCPDHVRDLIGQAREGYDVVIGSRLVAGGADHRRSRSRRWLTRVSNAYARIALGVEVRDCNSGFRAWTRRALQTTDAAHAKSVGPAIVHELLLRAKRSKLRIAEVPIKFVERERGESKLGFFTLVRGMLSVASLRLSRPAVNAAMPADSDRSPTVVLR